MKKNIVYLFLVMLAILMLFPFYWMIVLSTRSTTEIFRFPPPLWFGTNIASNFASMNQSVHFLQAFFNSSFVATVSMCVVIFFCSLGGYAFAMYRFPGREILFTMLLGTMMIPYTAGIIPW